MTQGIILKKGWKSKSIRLKSKFFKSNRTPDDFPCKQFRNGDRRLSLESFSSKILSFEFFINLMLIEIEVESITERYIEMLSIWN